MKCPCDFAPLAIRDAEGHIGYRCPKCRGAWLPRKYVESIRYERLFRYEAFAKALAASPTKEAGLDCPAGCGRLADIVAFEPSFSWCRVCQGIWFDRGELGDLLARIPKADGPWEAVDDKSTTGGTQTELLPRYELPFHIQSLYFLISFILIILGAIGVWSDDLFIPGTRGRPGVHYHGVPMWFIAGAMACAVANLISVIMDHYDTRHNERHYKRFARVTFASALLLFASGSLLDLIFFKSSSLFYAR